MREKLCVLALDPSLTAFGWSVVRCKKVMAAGCIKTEPLANKLRIRKGDDDCRRIQEIVEKLTNIIEEWGVNYIVAEQSYGAQSATAAKALAFSKAIVQTLSVSLKIELEWYNENDAKKAVSNKILATKSDMIWNINLLYRDTPWTKTKYIDEAIADSLAIFHVASKTSPVIKTLMK